ncbi:hypothetical protein JHW43_006822 [Diplocarpon mali]|nr:hypothetical protein JHW43_006822 [Diplocarpon mali]
MPASCSHQHLVLGQAQPISELSSCRLAEPLQSPGSRRPQKQRTRPHESPRQVTETFATDTQPLVTRAIQIVDSHARGGGSKETQCKQLHVPRHPSPYANPAPRLAHGDVVDPAGQPRSPQPTRPVARSPLTAPHHDAARLATRETGRRRAASLRNLSSRAGSSMQGSREARCAMPTSPTPHVLSIPPPRPRGAKPSTLAVARQRSEPAAQGSLGRGDEGIRESAEPHGRSEKRGRPLLLVAPVPSAGRLRPTAPSSRRKTPLPSGRVAPLPPSRVARGICCHVARAANSLPFQTPATAGQIYVVPILVRCSTLQSLLFRRATPPAASHTNQSNPTSSKSQAEPSSDTLQKASPPLPSSRVRSERSHPSEIPALDRLGTERGSPRDVDSQAPYARPA